jgi:hypothetical protein
MTDYEYQGLTPLVRQIQAGNLDEINALLEDGADPNEACRLSEHTCVTPVYQAVLIQRADIVETLLAHGADCDAASIDVDGRVFPLQITAMRGLCSLAALLLENGASVDTPAKRVSPLLISLAFDFPDMAKMFVEQGADVNLTDDRDGTTPMQWAVFNGHFELVDMMINRGAEIEAVDFEGNTALHIAAHFDLWDFDSDRDLEHNSHLHIWNLLCEISGAMWNANSAGKTPSDIFIAGWRDVIERHISSGAIITAEDIFSTNDEWTQDRLTQAFSKQEAREISSHIESGTEAPAKTNKRVRI